MLSRLVRRQGPIVRFVQKRFSSLLTSPKQEELKIPVPWGHIAGKTWGNPQGIPVICLHGWLDNSCSFDKLAPLLPNDSHRFIAIDLPGHGFSSHFPEGMTYRFSDTFSVLKYAKEYMNIQKFAIIGHSLGAGVGVWYSSIFPEDVDRLISIDFVNVGPVTLEKHAKKTKEAKEDCQEQRLKTKSCPRNPKKPCGPEIHLFYIIYFPFNKQLLLRTNFTNSVDV